MALLKCKMCGGTLEIDREKHLAVCPYCGSKSTVFDQDRMMYEQLRAMLDALSDSGQDRKADREGFWVEEQREQLTSEDGRAVEITWLCRDRADMCTVYTAKKHVIFLFDRGCDSYAEKYLEMTGAVRYPHAGMEGELGQYLPHVDQSMRLADGRRLIALHKDDGVYPLRLLGRLLDRHVAWVVSRLENLCCLLAYNNMVLNGLTVDNLFVDPQAHQIYVYGGWWFAGYGKGKLNGMSADVKDSLPRLLREGGRCDSRTDLESLRFVAARLLGYDSRAGLKSDRLLPEPFREFLLGNPRLPARKDFALWDEVLLASYGERKYIPLPVTQEQLYSGRLETED